MKKRGGRKTRRKTAKKKPKARTKKIQAPSREVKEAEKVVEKEERFIEKEIRFAFGPQELHVTLFVVSLIILAFLFSSISLIFYAVLSIAALLFAHFMRHHEHRPHEIITIIGLFFVPLAITIMAFRDVFIWLLLAVYIISVISTIVIYYYHKKAHSPLKIMWQVTYSRVIAITAALLVACILPLFLFPDAFLSIPELIFIYVLPVALVFFFFSKFFYIYFFDRKHIRADLLKSLRYTITYTLVFVILLICLYSIFAAAMYNSRTDMYTSDLDFALIGIDNIEKAVMKFPPEMQQMMVTKDLLSLTSEMRDEVSLEKSIAMERTISFSDILDDSYFSVLANDSFNTLRFTVLHINLAGLKEDIIEKSDAIKNIIDNNLTFDDGTTTIEEHISSMKQYAEDNFVFLSRDPDVQDTVAKLNEPSPTFSFFEGQGFFYWFGEEVRFGFVYGSESIFGRQMSVVLRHAEPFRHLAQLTLNAVIFLHKEAVSNSVMERLYENSESDTIPMSSAIRYTIIKDSIESAQEKAEEASAVSFRVE